MGSFPLSKTAPGADIESLMSASSPPLDPFHSSHTQSLPSPMTVPIRPGSVQPLPFCIGSLHRCWHRGLPSQPDGSEATAPYNILCRRCRPLRSRP